MFQNVQPLDKNQHAALRFTPAANLAYTRDLTTAPLLASEVIDAALCFPVLFPPEGQVRPLAVLGLIDRNTFLDDQNAWTAEYVPAHVRRYPFILGKVADEGQFVVMIDVDAPQFEGQDGEPLFTSEGGPTPHTQANIDFLQNFEKSMQQDQQVLAELETSGVLSAKELSIKDGDTTRLIGGFRTVDAQKVNELDDATLARWERNGLLTLIHAHWISLRHLNKVAVASGRLKAQQ